MTLREKAIEATFQAMGRAEVGDDEAVGRALARAALDAVLSLLAEPDDAMIEAFWEAGAESWGGTNMVLRKAVQAMIRNLQED